MRTASESDWMSVCLGPHRVLDGSLASLWAVEEVLDVCRKTPALFEQCGWIPEYLARFAVRAFTEMGCAVEREGWVVRVTTPGVYAFDLDDVATRLSRPMRLIPTMRGQYCSGLPMFGSAAAPHWGAATVVQDHAWADVGEPRDAQRVERGVEWTVREHVRGMGVPAGWDASASRVVRAMVWPPLGSDGQRQRGEVNLAALRALSQSEDRGVLEALARSLLRHPDAFIVLFAGWLAVELRLEPDDPHEANGMADAMAFFAMDGLPDAFRFAVQVLDPRPTADAGGATPDGLKALSAVANSDPAKSLEVAEQLLGQADVAAWWTARGIALARAEQLETAQASFDEALARNPDYLLARTTRAEHFTRMGRFAEAEADLLLAQEVWPESPGTRSALLANRLAALAAGTPISADTPDEPSVGASRGLEAALQSQVAFLQQELVRVHAAHDAMRADRDDWRVRHDRLQRELDALRRAVVPSER